MPKISSILAREIYDSRGTPTVEADLLLDDGSFGRAAVPSGASTGMYEVLELRDGGKRLFGKGVRTAVTNVKTKIFPAVKGMEADQQAVDKKMIELDGTPTKETLGANAILAVSMALSKALSQSRKQPLWDYFRGLSTTVPKDYILPVPMINILNGGKHAEKSADIQEYIIMPIGAKTFSEALEMGATVFMSLKKLLSKEGFSTAVGDEGGFAPTLHSNHEPLVKITQAIKEAGYIPGEDIVIGLDSAASEFYADGKYHLQAEGRVLTTDEMINLYEEGSREFPIFSIEDGLDQNDWEGWEKLTKRLGDKIQIVGDDFYVTNVKRLEEGIRKKASNAILIKLNQIGTVTETVAAIDLARKNGWNAIVSHRSGETEDTTIADFVVGLSTGQIKTGSMSRSERISKYNQLLRIEEALGSKAVYLGKGIFKK